MSLERRRRRRQAAAAPVTQSNGSRFNLRGFSQIFLPKSFFTHGRFSIECLMVKPLLIEAFYSFFLSFWTGLSLYMVKKEWIGIELFLRVLFKAILLKELGTGLLHYFLHKFVLRYMCKHRMWKIRQQSKPADQRSGEPPKYRSYFFFCFPPSSFAVKEGNPPTPPTEKKVFIGSSKRRKDREKEERG